MELPDIKAKHKLRVVARAKYLATLTPAQRRSRDNYVAWVRWWREDYKRLVTEITKNKLFLRKQGHNNLKSLKLAMWLLEYQRRKAHMMLLARAAAKAEHQYKQGTSNHG